MREKFSSLQMCQALRNCPTPPVFLPIFPLFALQTKKIGRKTLHGEEKKEK